MTEEHPFLVNGKWIPANQLKIGDIIQTLDGKNVTIKSLENIVNEEAFPVYNLEVNNYSNFVLKDDLIVHNSRAGNIYMGGGVQRLLTTSELEVMLTKPGGNPEVGRLHASAVSQVNMRDFGGRFDPLDNVYMRNLEHIIRTHIESSQRYPTRRPGYDAMQRDHFNDVLAEINELRNPLIPRTFGRTRSTNTPFTQGPNNRFGNAYQMCIDNIFSRQASNLYDVEYQYRITRGGVTETVEVQHMLVKDWGRQNVQFIANGGVINSAGNVDFEGLMILLNELRFKAINARTYAERARAIADFEWVHSVTSPSRFGGGTVLMDLDYPLIQQAGFTIRDIVSRRIELEALSMPRDQWLNQRTAELMTGAPQGSQVSQGFRYQGPLFWSSVGLGTLGLGTLGYAVISEWDKDPDQNTRIENNINQYTSP